MRYFDNNILFSNKILLLFCNEKRGGLWMVRHVFYHGGCMLIFVSQINYAFADKNLCYIGLPV